MANWSSFLFFPLNVIIHLNVLHGAFKACLTAAWLDVVLPLLNVYEMEEIQWDSSCAQIKLLIKMALLIMYRQSYLSNSHIEKGFSPEVKKKIRIFQMKMQRMSVFVMGNRALPDETPLLLIKGD